MFCISFSDNYHPVFPIAFVRFQRARGRGRARGRFVFIKFQLIYAAFMRFKEFLALYWLNLKVQKHNFVEYCKVIVRYYSNTAFAKTDLKLLSEYFLQNPFRISRDFLKGKIGGTDTATETEELYAYGETPLTTFGLITQKANLKTIDTLYELGCGRGRCCFWAHHFIGCKVVGIDFVPPFIQKASTVVQKRDLKGIEFRCEDFLLSDLTDATAIYLYGTCYDAPFLKTLSKKLAKLPPATLVISVSYPLTDYAPPNTFEVLHRFSAPFTWGEGDVYIQQKKYS